MIMSSGEQFYLKFALSLEDVHLPQSWQFGNFLESDTHVNEGFRVLSLLEHARDTNTILAVPHTFHDNDCKKTKRARN
jgi:hypothetical protein